MVVAVPYHADGEGESRNLVISKWALDFLNYILLIQRFDGAVRFGERGLQIVSDIRLRLYILRTILIGGLCAFFAEDARGERFKSIAYMFELLSRGPDRIGSFEVAGNIGSGRREVILIFRNDLRRAHDVALDAAQLPV